MKPPDHEERLLSLAVAKGWLMEADVQSHGDIASRLVYRTDRWGPRLGLLLHEGRMSEAMVEELAREAGIASAEATTR